MDESNIIKELIEKGELPTKENISHLANSSTEIEPSVNIVENHLYEPEKIKAEDFVEYMRRRYEYIKNLLIKRPEVEEATSISRLSNDREQTVIIALVSEITRLPSGAIRLVLEDLTGKISAIVSVKDPELAKNVGYLTLDEVCAFKGSKGNNIFFVNEIVWPDIPQKPKTCAPDEVYVAFTADLHVGSNMFLPKQLDRFIGWLNGKVGSDEQKKLAEKTKYVFILGDIVDGIGIYPGQEEELIIKDIKEQYRVAAEYLSRIPKDKKIIICPGNHDAVRLCEPQPLISKSFAAPLYELPNATFVSNPALVNIHSGRDFEGFNILLYHGYSFDYFVDAVEALRDAGGYDRPDKLIGFLLKRRHLAPTYGSTVAIPMKNDPLLIRKIPDIVATGHIHKAKIGTYKNILTISASCWQDRTSFQERVGHNPEPAIVPLINLQTGNGTMLKFR